MKSVQAAPDAPHRRRISAIRGGPPIMVDSKAFGAIGVSGGNPEQDEQCAEARLAALH